MIYKYSLFYLLFIYFINTKYLSGRLGVYYLSISPSECGDDFVKKQCLSAHVFVIKWNLVNISVLSGQNHKSVPVSTAAFDGIHLS